MGMGMNHSCTNTTVANPAYDARWQRVMDCVSLRQPDRMPTALFANFWLATYGGINYRQLMYDPEALESLILRVTQELDPDLVYPAKLLSGFGPLLDATGYKQLQWPGHGVDENRPCQYLDREYMSADEYDDFLFDPTGFYFAKYLPRIASAFEGLEALSSYAGACYYGAMFQTVIFADPRMSNAFGELVNAGRVTMRLFGEHMQIMGKLTAMGYPSGIGGCVFGAYDAIADYYRGATNMMKDLFRHGDKVLEVLEKMTVLTLRQVAAQKPTLLSPLIMIPVHWAADAFMSQKQFEKFWWPSFRKLMIGIIDMGLIPMPLWEADCTKRLETIKDIPPGKCIYWFERTDMVKAFEVLGDVVALRGNVGASVLCTGTPEQVDAEVKRLVDQVWNRGGNLILDSAFGVPDETPVENVRAMYSAARKYAG
jgi:hypothetical protein